MALGTVAAMESNELLKHDGRLLADAVGAASGAAALLLVMGFLTPVAGALLALNTAALWMAGDTGPSRLDHPMALLRVGSSIAIALLGPGAYALDARLFGRREVVIDLERPSRSQRPSS
jgi:uncharacterized membrane protein YphA (DoxX/SURF4 family)